MLRLDRAAAVLAGFISREKNGSSSCFREQLKHSVHCMGGHRSPERHARTYEVKFTLMASSCILNGIRYEPANKNRTKTPRKTGAMPVFSSLSLGFISFLSVHFFNLRLCRRQVAQH